jgi:hypothetical protein
MLFAVKYFKLKLQATELDDLRVLEYQHTSKYLVRKIKRNIFKVSRPIIFNNVGYKAQEGINSK